jgi:hypothetical protein
MIAVGTSGSWVVRGGRLCGYIVAVYEKEPYAHIITAEKALSDVLSVWQHANPGNEPEILRVATAEDTEELSRRAMISGNFIKPVTRQLPQFGMAGKGL